MSKKRNQGDGEGDVVYRRLPVPGKGTGSDVEIDATRSKIPFAPTLRPLLIGFILLLALIGLLGLFGKRELDTVESGTSLLLTQFKEKLRQNVNMHSAALSLNNEARTRAWAELRGDLTPPGNLRYATARREVESQIETLERMPFAKDPNWQKLREQLQEFLETTRDRAAYSLNGFSQFRDIEAQFRVIDGDLSTEETLVSRRSEALRDQSSRRVTYWWVTALLIGLLVIAASLWEVQRRFRHEQQSLLEARRERQFSTQMLEGMVSAVAAVDSNAKIRSANSAFFELFPEASVGASVYDLSTTPEARGLLEKVVSSRGAAGYLGRSAIGPGARVAPTKSYDLYSSPLEIDDENGQIITMVDVSDAAQAEAMIRRTEALAAVGQASAQVAHEIRNPLGSIRLGVSMLRDMIKSDDAITTINLVERGIDHLNKLVVNVTQFSRSTPLAQSEFDLNTLIDSSLELVRDLIEQKRARIDKSFTGGPLRGKWDEDQLRQVFVNLLANAVDASKKDATVAIITDQAYSDLHGGDVRAHDESKSLSAGERVARVSIIDKGEGMDEATRARIFEPFFTTKKRGTGLGLAIVKQIVERHGGTISVHSKPGEGSRFVVDLPLRVNDGVKA